MLRLGRIAATGELARVDVEPVVLGVHKVKVRRNDGQAVGAQNVLHFSCKLLT